MKKWGFACIVLGIVFVLYAIFGRYIVLPGYMESLEAGTSAGGSIPENVDAWKVARYLIWAYSFKLGIYFVVLGALLQNAVKKGAFAAYAIGGLVYIGFAYMPISGPSLLYGIGGGMMTIAIILILVHLAKIRNAGAKAMARGVDFRLCGYFFFAMATYNLCPLLGVKCFALSPEQMIQYGLQTQAESFAAHILIELVIGWCFLLASYLLKGKQQGSATAPSC